MGTCIQQGDLFYSAGLPRIRCQPQPTQEKIGRGFGKNAGERTNKEEIRLEELSEKTESCQANSWNERAIKTEIDTQEQK